MAEHKAKRPLIFTSEKRRHLCGLHPAGSIKDMISARMHWRDRISSRKDTSGLLFTVQILS